MRISIYCLLIALALNVAFSQTVEVPSDAKFITSGDRVILIKGKVAGDTRVWLVIEAYNASKWKANGFDPCFTRVVCDYKPLFRKIGNQWEIMFTSELTEKLP